MTTLSIIQNCLDLFILLILIKPLGQYIASIYASDMQSVSRKPARIIRFFNPLLARIYRFCKIDPLQEMTWLQYLQALLIFNFLGLLAVYALARLQFYLPLNPQHFAGLSPDLAFNTAVSFVTNTNWQAYTPESSLSYLTQTLGLTVQNFLSTATGMAILIAMIRGLIRQQSRYIGNFWVDIIRCTFYILLPLSFALAMILISQGVSQNYQPYSHATLLQPAVNQEGISITNQTIPLGPAASQIAIKQLGTNGGGFFNTNSAHPLENPTPLTNLLETLAILLIPAALCYSFGIWVQQPHQGLALLLVMLSIFIPSAGLTLYAEQTTPINLSKIKPSPLPTLANYPHGNLEGKETRIGIAGTTFWATATTATSNGSVNGMLDSFTSLGILAPIWLMHLGEIVFGGVGSGLYGMLLIVILTVFIAGLMVGRTPEYLGKKIEPFELKMAALAVLIMPLITLGSTALACVIEWGTSAIGNPGIRGFSEILYAFSSVGNNNGSSLAGLNANTPFYNIVGGIMMLICRYWIAIPTLAIAGSMAKKKKIPLSAGTLNTSSTLFILLLLGVILLFAALSFFPSLALGPIAEYLIFGR